MPVTPYTSLESVRAYLGIAGTSDDGLLTSLIGIATREIERRCKRKFIAQPADQTRYYTISDIQPIHRQAGVYFPDEAPLGGLVYFGGQNAILNVRDDLASITTLTNGDGSAIAPTSYWLYPYNGPPYYAVQLLSSFFWTFATDQRIALTGQFVYSLTPPEDIVHATNRLVGWLYRSREAQSYGTTADPASGQLIFPTAFPKDVDALLREGAYIRSIRFA